MSEDEYKEIVFSVMLGALTHDFGKPATTKHESDGRIRSINHETEGEAPVRNFLARLNVSNNILKKIYVF